MSFDDDKWRGFAWGEKGWPSSLDPLPTRSGTPSGKANERVMLEKHPANTISRSVSDDTMLVTRGGMPHFSKLTSTVTDVYKNLRGFAISVYNGVKGKLFSTDDLSVEKDNYEFVGHGYFVASIATDKPAQNPKKWRDVVFFRGHQVFVNAKVPQSLATVYRDDTDKAVPFLLTPSPSGYGEAIDYSGSARRVFQINKDGVKTVSIADEAQVEADLIPTLPREENRAQLLGFSIDAEVFEITLNQIFFQGPSWDSILSLWFTSHTTVHVSASSPFVTSESGLFSCETPPVDMGSPALSAVELDTEPGSFYLPEACVAGLYTAGVQAESGFGYAKAGFVSAEWFKAPVPAHLNSWKNVELYSASLDLSEDLFSGSNANTIEFGDIFEQKIISSIEKPSGASIDRLFAVGSYQILWNEGAHTWYWADEPFPSASFGSQGGGVRSNLIAFGSPPSPLVNYSRIEQTGAFHIDIDGMLLIDGSFGNVVESGNDSFATALDIAPPPVPSDTTVFHTGGVGTEEVQLLAEPILTSKAAEWVGLKAFDRYQVPSNYYEWSVAARPNIDDKFLEWETRDYIYFDKLNEVSIYLKSIFSATQSYGDSVGIGTLSCSIVIDATTGVAEQNVYSTTFESPDILPRVELVTGKSYIPSPLIRRFFCPIAMEQGDFKGVAYTTKDEVENGAEPHVLVNFALQLRNFSYIGTEPSNNSAVDYVPCNLLEMLYAYVFSKEYGLNEFNKYPISSIFNYKKITEGFFANLILISYRDGAFVDWCDAFSGQYASEPYSEIYRT